MAKDKVEEKVEVVEEVVEAVVPEKGDSAAKAEFRKIIEAYKVSNPAKYELKKDELAKKLAAL